MMSLMQKCLNKSFLVRLLFIESVAASHQLSPAELSSDETTFERTKLQAKLSDNYRLNS
jgi:hypothetical protein